MPNSEKFHLHRRALCLLFNQQIRPHLDHGMAACPPSTCTEAKTLEAVQSKATTLVHGLNSEERRKKLGLMKLEERRERGDLIEVFKILKGQTRIDPALFWEVRNARGVRLVKELAAKGRRKRQSFLEPATDRAKNCTIARLIQESTWWDDHEPKLVWSNFEWTRNGTEMAEILNFLKSEVESDTVETKKD